MAKLQSQLKNVAKSLAALAEKIEKISTQMGGDQAPARAKAAPKKAAAPKKEGKKKAPAAKKSEAGTDTVLEKVYDVISKSRNGATIANLKTKTGLESRQLSNALYKLSKKGKIQSKARGVYIKA